MSTTKHPSTLVGPMRLVTSGSGVKLLIEVGVREKVAINPDSPEYYTSDMRSYWGTLGPGVYHVPKTYFRVHGISPHLVRRWAEWLPPDLEAIGMAYSFVSDERVIAWQRGGVESRMSFPSYMPFEEIETVVRVAMRMEK